ncbi:CYFA0S05e00936g1_1 [Cyberlindnera fabianii]|uniref:HECT-type E3 ubiquitin transferase n=1 Tax=Cyberlindnera fabianii TaxID=36022 RepID=A0A061AS89_CYBFA|nr:CYFA0S05e00936g1_1 [Cyberlindnera fabianii]
MSLNFNGQLKKRTVNIGGGFRQNRSNLLQQTQRERERREKERQREKAYTTIQRAVRRKRELHSFHETISLSWNEDSVNSGKYRLPTLIFWFNTFYADIYRSNPNSLPQITLLHSLVNGNCELPYTSKVGLLTTISETIPRLDIHSDDDIFAFNLLLDIALTIHTPPEQIKRANVPLIPAISKIAQRLTENADYSCSDDIIEVVNTYAEVEPLAYLSFLSSSWLIGYPSFKVNFAAIRKGFNNGMKLPSDTDIKINMLTGIIDETKNYADKDFIAVVAHLASSIDRALLTRAEEQSLDYDSTEYIGNQMLVSDHVNESIKKLYSREFTTAVPSIVEDTRLFSLLAGSLITIRPNLKSTFIISVLPAVFGPLLDSLLGHDMFKMFSDYDENALVGISADFLKDVFIDHHDFIRYELYLFLELLQYRLLVSNDFDIFGQYGFTKEKFTLLSIFLKKFVFNLIWNSKKITQCFAANSSQITFSPKKFEQLFKLSITVLSQVYLKDTRLKVMPANAWLLNSQRLELNHLIDTIADYDEKKNEAAYDSDDEGDSYINSLPQETQAKLQIYLKTPFFISFHKRVEIFQALIDRDRSHLGLNNSASLFGMDFMQRRHIAEIRREHLLNDAYESFGKMGGTFKNQLAIRFINKHGTEDGVDGGGLTKEFLTGVVKEGFNGLFIENYNHELYPDPEIGIKYQYRVDSAEQLLKLNHTNFMGKVIGKCLYDRVLVDACFAPFFLTKLNRDFRNSFDDLNSLDPDLYANLVKLLSMSEEELAALALTFSVDERVGNKSITINLIPNGSMVPVTTSNRLKFIHEMSDYKLNKVINTQSNSFLTGLYEIVSKDWLAMFNPYELQILISGETDINITDLKTHTVYGGFSEQDKTITDFWEVVEEMTNEEKSLLVKFATSVPRAPLLGFKALNPQFGITNAGGLKEHSDSLPTASTCVNLLKLPNYQNKEKLRQKLLYAIKAEAGFDLN